MIDIQEQFKSALSRWVSGVAVILCNEQQHVEGITVSAFMSGSLNPPLICFAINRSSDFNERLMQSELFSLNILNSEQRSHSDYWAGWLEEMEDSVIYKNGQAYIDQALAHLTLKQYARHDCGDHWLYVAELVAADSYEHKPLMYYRSAYGIES